MPQAAEAPRQFRVLARHVDSHYARVLEETSFEAAAIAYVEDFPPPFTDEGEFRVLVREIDTGHEHCFRIDLRSGDTEPLG